MFNDKSLLFQATDFWGCLLLTETETVFSPQLDWKLLMDVVEWLLENKWFYMTGILYTLYHLIHIGVIHAKYSYPIGHMGNWGLESLQT